MKTFSEAEKNAILDTHFNLHGNSYTPCLIDSIRKEFGSNYTDVFTQIYHSMSLLDDEENPYIGFADIIEKNYGMDINVLEIGGGIFPALGDVIAKRQSSIGKGSITVFDPFLSKNLDLKNIHLNKRFFDMNENISSYDFAKYLGHTKIEETLKTYSHLFLSSLDEIVEVIDDLEK